MGRIQDIQIVSGVCLALFVPLGLSGCATRVKSAFDDVRPVYLADSSKSRYQVEKAKTPPGFMVTPQEIREIQPFEKGTLWNLYADDQYYYLSGVLPGLLGPQRDDSYTAMTIGLRIRGTTREEYERAWRRFQEARDSAGKMWPHFGWRRGDLLDALEP